MHQRKSDATKQGQNIDRLVEQLHTFADEYPESYGLLRHSPNMFDACSVPVWHARGWDHVNANDIDPLLEGTEVERLSAMLRLVQPHGIRRVEFADGMNRIEVVPLVARAA